MFCISRASAIELSLCLRIRTSSVRNPRSPSHASNGASVVPVLQAQAEMADARAVCGQAKAGGSVAAGGGGITLADLPNWSLALIGIATLIALVIFTGNRRHEPDRAAAWRKASEAKP